MKKYYIISTIVALALFIIGIIGVMTTGAKYVENGIDISNGLSFFNSSININNEDIIQEGKEVIKEIDVTNNKIEFDIDVFNTKLEIESEDVDKVTVKLYSFYEDKFIINDDNGKVTIVANEDLNNGWINNGFNNTSIIEIIVPENITSNYKVETSNGSVEASDINVDYININTSNAVFGLDNIIATEEIELKTSNGIVSAEELQAKNITITTSNGVVNIEELKGDNIEVETRNGGIKAEDCYAKNVSLKTTNGYLSLDNDDEYIIENLYAYTTNGKETINAKYNNRN